MAILHTPDCDGCRFVPDHLISSLSVAHLRKLMKEQGWKKLNGFDYCPECVERKTKEKADGHARNAH